MAETLNLISSVTTKSSGSILKYPKDIFVDKTDFVKFKFYKYKGPFGGNTPTNSGDLGGALSLYNQSNEGEYSAYEGVNDVVFYMPEDISTGYSYSWGGKDFSNIGANLLRGGGSLLNGQIGGTAAAVTQLIQNTMGALPTMGAEALANGINATGAGNLTTNDVLAGSVGVVLNPNTELLFDGFKMRNFSLRFKMAPRNKDEAVEMRKIIGTFKKVASPTFGPAGGALDIGAGLSSLFKGAGQTETTETTSTNPEPATASASTDTIEGNVNANYIGVPGLCQVFFMKGSELHPYLPQYKICAISDISINYTPDGVYSTYHEDGAPVAVELQLSFAETKLVYSNEININGASY